MTPRAEVWVICLGVALALAGCPDGGPGPDASEADGGADSGVADTGARDGGARDTGRRDGGGRDAGDAGGGDGAAADGGDGGPAGDSGGADGASADAAADARPADAALDASFDAGPALPCVDGILATTGLAVASGTNVGMGDDLRSFTCAGPGGLDVTYQFVAPVAGSYVFDTAGSDYDTVLSLHLPDCADPKERACSDDVGAGRTEASVAATLEAGESVLINIDALDDTELGAWVLNIGRADDVCPTADLGSATGVGVASGGIDAAAADGRTASCSVGGGGRELTYTFTAPATRDYTFVLPVSTTVFDAVIYVLDGACAGPELACNDDAVAAMDEASVTVPLTAGQTVTVVVEGLDADEVGAFTLDVL